MKLPPLLLLGPRKLGNIRLANQRRFVPEEQYFFKPGDDTFFVTENESTYIPVGVVHALENPGKVPLELIEVQSGSYLGEDDIIRFEDRYGRTNS